MADAGDSGKTECEYEGKASSAALSERDAARGGAGGAVADTTKPRPAGCVFTWGQGASGELGHSKMISGKICPFPTRVPGLSDVVQVACGENCTAAVDAAGQLWTWGSGRGGRLGHSSEAAEPAPRVVQALKRASVRVTQVSVGEAHVLCVDSGGGAWAWGRGSHGALGRGDTSSSSVPVPVLAAPATKRDTAARLGGVASVKAGFQSSGAVLADGRCMMWGAGGEGRLGLGDTKDRAFPTELEGGPEEVASLALGSLVAGVVGRDGSVWMWGYGGHGNLGQGNRKSHRRPVRVGGELLEKRVVHLAVTVGQINPQRPTDRRRDVGTEGPHTLAVTDDGSVYSWGTCHKGMLGNMRDKILCYDGDELVPYRIGSAFRDHPEDGDSSGYLQGCHIVQAAASSIHSAVLDAAGDVHSFGCGSTGRMGVKKFMTGLSGHRSRMKCYISAPILVDAFRDQDVRVLQIDTARRHMVALGVYRSGAVQPRRHSMETGVAHRARS